MAEKAKKSKVEKEVTVDQEATAEELKNEKKAVVEATTKAGKHSKKALEAEATKEAKEERKAKKKEEAEDKPKQIQKPHVKKYSKNQKAARELLEFEKLYTLKEAIELLPKLSKTKFDATAELHATLGIDAKAGDQQVRSSAALPAGTGKEVKVAVITDDKNAASAKKAGADSVDADQLLADIGKGKFNFDVLIASPDKMGDLGRHAKVLGPKGLMPSPKNGTVTNDPATAVAEIKKGRAEIKNDASGIVHVAFGKLSFKNADLLANAKVVVAAIAAARPTGIKGIYLKSLYVTSSMSPSIKLDISSALKEAKE